MARTALTPVTLTANAVVSDPAGTALDATNDHKFTAAAPTSQYLVRVTNTTSSTKTVQLKAGAGSSATEAGAGDLTLSLTAGNVTPTTKWFGPFSSARFLQADGTVNIDVDASMTGTVTVFKIPSNF